MTYFVDIVSYCNNQCILCPTGRKQASVKHQMSPELFADICRTIVGYGGKGVSLFSWTDPLLHPAIFEFLRIANHAGLRVSISTNGLHLQDWPRVLEDVSTLRVSVYDLHAKEGLLFRVLEALQQYPEKVEVAFQMTRKNLYQYQAVRRLAKKYGYKFNPLISYQMPLERTLDQQVDPSLVTIQEAATLLVPVARYKEIAGKKATRECPLLTRTRTINCHGQVELCCATNIETGADYSDVSAAITHAFCQRCQLRGLNKIALYHNPLGWCRNSVQPLPLHFWCVSVLRHITAFIRKSLSAFS
jgi:MoaA/NifB/PqqE/SkfB family radical SAM enzyme